MNTQKVARILTNTLSGVLVVGLAAAAPARGQASGTWTTTGSMSGPSRTYYVATLLSEWPSAVAGGEEDNAALASSPSCTTPATSMFILL
jgi:hypothetical protein